MRLDESFLRTVCFLCSRRVDAGVESYEYKGTGFFIAYQDRGLAENMGFVYFVTAKHVVEKARTFGPLYARVNEQGGGVRYVELVDDEWFTSPTADVAVQQTIFSGSPIDLIPDHMLMTDGKIHQHDVGVGDDLILCGLFTKHYGQQRNVPIVRSGIISAMPDEPIRVQGGPSYPGYLVEVRSLGGLSGSPVFIVFDYDRKSATRFQSPPMFLLGLVRGHWDYSPELDAADADAARELAGINTGIAIVTPAQDLLALLNGDELDRHREDTLRRGSQPRRGATLDT
jgi:hypothetical protein